MAAFAIDALLREFRRRERRVLREFEIFREARAECVFRSPFSSHRPRDSARKDIFRIAPVDRAFSIPQTSRAARTPPHRAARGPACAWFLLRSESVPRRCARRYRIRVHSRFASRDHERSNSANCRSVVVPASQSLRRNPLEPVFTDGDSRFSGSLALGPTPWQRSDLGALVTLQTGQMSNVGWGRRRTSRFDWEKGRSANQC